MHAKSLQSCDTMDSSPPVSSVHGILQARILEWIAMALPGDLPKPGIKLACLMSPTLAGMFLTTSTTWEARAGHYPQANYVSEAELVSIVFITLHIRSIYTHTCLHTCLHTHHTYSHNYLVAMVKYFSQSVCLNLTKYNLLYSQQSFCFWEDKFSFIWDWLLLNWHTKKSKLKAF